MIFLEMIVVSHYVGDENIFTNHVETDFKSRQKEIFDAFDQALFLELVTSDKIENEHYRHRFVVVSNGYPNGEEIVQKLSSFFPNYRLRVVRQEEITSKEFMKAVKTYSGQSERLLSQLGVFSTGNLSYHADNWPEFVVSRNKEYTLSSDCLIYGNTFQEELERIKAHPHHDPLAKIVIHYVIEESGDNLEMINLLVQTLSDAHRLQSRRVAFLEIKSTETYVNRQLEYLEALFTLCQGGTLVVKFPKQVASGNYLMENSSESTIARVLELFQIYQEKIQFIFLFKSSHFEEQLRKYFPKKLFFEFRENSLTQSEALSYLELRAKEDGIQETQTLPFLISGRETSYTGQYLRQLYSSWLDSKAITEFYPEYQEVFREDKPSLQKRVIKSAYERLQELVGIEESKKMVLQFIHLLKIQQVRREQGLESEHPNMHMVFTGNPGTGKTTVARLIAEILKEEKILPQGELIDGSRDNLIARYTGQTAPLVKQAFNRAKGSVLFIDEAYSFLDEGMGYGSEAIATIVKEMENLRSDTVVIFAGYKEPMEEFINSNEGLRSRIALYIDFPDYSGDELMQITDLILKNKNYRITPKTHQFLLDFYQTVPVNKTSGNGRLVRNIVESAERQFATRLAPELSKNLSINKLTTLVQADFKEAIDKYLDEQNKKQESVIGFKK